MSAVESPTGVGLAEHHFEPVERATAFGVFAAVDGDRDGNTRAARRGFDDDRPTVRVDDPACDREAETGTRVVGRPAFAGRNSARAAARCRTRRR